jgi:hypothetical protein
MGDPTDQQLFTCRRRRRCREKLPLDALERDRDSGELYCRPGACPNHRYSEDDNLIPLQLEVRRLREDGRRLAGENERLLGELDAAQDRLGVALDIRDIRRPSRKVVPISEAGRARSESVPVLLCSDWHCGAVVKAEHVSGLNTFDVGVFHARAAALFRNAVKVIAMARSSVDIEQMVLWLGGDLIDNQIHPEQAQTQELTPTQQIVECERAIVAGIDYLLEHAGLERIIIPCSVGNHGRTTPKQQSNAAQNSYEWLMYQSLRRHYRGEDRIEWHIDEGNILYLNVLGHNLRFHHGDAVRYGGGVGGITIPMAKWIYRQDVGIRADHTFLGHFHTLTMGGGFSINGSLIGATPYSIKLGFPPERPQQLMRFIDSERGFTLSAPILTD